MRTAAEWRSSRPVARCRDGGLRSELAACIWIPLFPLCCEERRHPELALKPVALIAPYDSRRLWQVSARARQAGVRVSMTVSQAVGLCPTLTICEPDPVHYDEQFARLLQTLGSVSPVVEPAELGRAFVGVDGLEKLYGPPERQLAAILIAIGGGGRRAATSGAAAGWKGGGWSSLARLGWGRGKFVAWVAATRAKPGEFVIITDGHAMDFLASQSVAVLPTDPDTHRRLSQLGIRTLRDLSRLPEVAVASQFGTEGRRLWQLATGSVVDVVVGRAPPTPIVIAVDFPCPLADRGMLTQALERLIERALRHPRRRGWRVLEARVRAQLEHGVSWTAHVTLKDPSAQAERIAAPLESRLEQTPPTGAAVALAVEFTDFVRGTDELQLFARDAASSARAGRRHALRAAVREIKTRFKGSGLYHVVEVQPQSRIPERRYALVDYEP